MAFSYFHDRRAIVRFRQNLLLFLLAHVEWAASLPHAVIKNTKITL